MSTRSDPKKVKNPIKYKKGTVPRIHHEDEATTRYYYVPWVDELQPVEQPQTKFANHGPALNVDEQGLSIDLDEPDCKSSFLETRCDPMNRSLTFCSLVGVMPAPNRRWESYIDDEKKAKEAKEENDRREAFGPYKSLPESERTKWNIDLFKDQCMSETPLPYIMMLAQVGRDYEYRMAFPIPASDPAKGVTWGDFHSKISDFYQRPITTQFTKFIDDSNQWGGGWELDEYTQLKSKPGFREYDPKAKLIACRMGHLFPEVLTIRYDFAVKQNFLEFYMGS